MSWTKYISILFIILLQSCGPIEKERENLANSQKITKDMNKKQVASLMGKPDRLGVTAIYYNTGNESYPEIIIDFDSLGNINDLHSPCKTKEQLLWANELKSK